MATASPRGKNSGNSALEKSAIKLIDDVLTSLQGKCTLSDLEDHFDQNASKAVKDYVLESDNNLKNFIEIRKHLWNSAEDSAVQQQSPNIRKMLYYLCCHIQHNRVGDFGGVKLEKICDLLEETFDSERQDMGPGMEPLKKFLQKFPFLFEFASPAGGVRAELGDVLVLFLGSAIDGVVLLPERLHGLGVLKHFDEQKSSGFMDYDRQGVYFVKACIQPPSLRSVDFSALIKNRSKFRFTAVVSRRYLLGETTRNKWRVIEMSLNEDEESDSGRISRQPRRSSLKRHGRQSATPRGRSLSVSWDKPLSRSQVDLRDSTADTADESYSFDEPQSLSQPDAFPSVPSDRSPSPDEFELQLKKLYAPVGKNVTSAIGANSFAPSTKPKSRLAFPLNTRKEPTDSKMGTNGNLDKTADKRDAQSQTEFNDDLENLLGRLKNRPDLVQKVMNILDILK